MGWVTDKGKDAIKKFEQGGKVEEYKKGGKTKKELPWTPGPAAEPDYPAIDADKLAQITGLKKTSRKEKRQKVREARKLKRQKMKALRSGGYDPIQEDTGKVFPLSRKQKRGTAKAIRKEKRRKVKEARVAHREVKKGIKRVEKHTKESWEDYEKRKK